jgi:DNA-binding MarR family transcriptional regulator
MTTKTDKRRDASSRKRRRSPRRAALAPASDARDASAALTPQVRSILDRFRLEDVVSHLLRRAHFAAEERFAREFADEQITPRQKAALIAVYQQPGLSQNMLAEHLFMDRNTVAEMVTRLVSRRLLERRPSAEDQRAYQLFLAGDGAAMLNRVMPRDAAIEQAILQRLPERSARLFMKYLRTIVQTS